VNGSKQALIYVFGDNHRDEREEVEQRLHSVIPESAEALVMEHAEKPWKTLQAYNWPQ